MAIITIIGAGMMGSAMAFPACRNGHTVRLVGTPLDDAIIASVQSTGRHGTLSHDVNGKKETFAMPTGVTAFYHTETARCIEGADLVVCGVSSFGVDWFCQNVLPLIPEDLPILSITKGMIDDGEGKGRLISYPEYMLRHTDKKLKICAVGGPCTSYELADLDPTEVTFCGPDMALLRRVKNLFETDFYHVSLSTDVRGVECAVALKNAYALGVSLAIGLSYRREGRAFEHYNSQAALFGQAAREMEKLLLLFGGKRENIFLGVGDLYVTVFGGRTRRVGTLLGEGKTIDEAVRLLQGVTLESLVIARRTVEAVDRLSAAGLADPAEYPLLCHIGELLNGKTVCIPWERFETEQTL